MSTFGTNCDRGTRTMSTFLKKRDRGTRFGQRVKKWSKGRKKSEQNVFWRNMTFSEIVGRVHVPLGASGWI